jgi:acyl-CoA thioester hydrolase
VTTCNRIVNRSDKRFHGMYYIVNETRGRLAGTLEYISAGVDMNLRRTAPMPDELARGLDRLHAAHQRLSWAPRLCGLMAP